MSRVPTPLLRRFPGGGYAAKKCSLSGSCRGLDKNFVV